MSPVALALLPDFLLLIGGAFLRRMLPPAAWQAIDRLNFNVLFPALIFLSALRARPAFDDLVVMGPGIWTGMLVACTLAWLVRGFGPARYLDFAGMWQTAWRFNTAFAVVAATALPAEHRGLMFVAIGLGVPFANVLAVAALSRGQGDRWRKTVLQVATNPFLVASLAGILLSLLDLRLPEPLAGAAMRLAEAAVPLALLSVGAAVQWGAMMRMDRFEVALNAIKLVVTPMMVWVVATGLGLGHGPTIVLTIFSALPTAAAAHVLASVYGADRERVATLITQSTVIGCVTLPIWLLILI